MNVTQTKKKITSAKALSFIPFNMLLICSMIVTCPNKPSLWVCVCVCVKGKKRNYDDLGLFLSGSLLCQDSFFYCIQGIQYHHHEWHCLVFYILNSSEFHAREKVSICSFLSPARIQNYMQLIAHFHGQHYSSLLSYWFVHMNEEGGVKDGIIPLPCPSLITGVSFLFFLGDINLFVKVNKIKNQN